VLRTLSLGPGMKNAVTLEPAIAGVLGERRAHCARLYLGLDIGNQLALAL
jgi:hypothetical protein